MTVLGVTVTVAALRCLAPLPFLAAVVLADDADDEFADDEFDDDELLLLDPVTNTSATAITAMIRMPASTKNTGLMRRLGGPA